jgi:hypothetical protein
MTDSSQSTEDTDDHEQEQTTTIPNGAICYRDPRDEADCDEHEIVWDDSKARPAAANLYTVPGTCHKCGGDFSLNYYSPTLYDEDTGEFLYDVS